MQFPFMRLSTWEVDQYRYANTWPKAIRLLEAGLLSDIRKFVTHRFPIGCDVKSGASPIGPVPHMSAASPSRRPARSNGGEGD
ncbi:hypothetical protein EDB84DRAFT_1463281 [Lactarius hengduanensis]|nr:hypothetical protein EDB84DRAFT_1463281 [Lactarius hengduanensis]